MNEEFDKREECLVIPIEESQQKKKTKKTKKYVSFAIIALVLNVVMISGIFATGYIAGNSGLLSGIVASAESSAEEKKHNEEISKILEERKDDNRTELTTAEVAKLVGPAVVGVVSEVEVQNYFWGTNGVSQSSGSGIIFLKEGNTYYIMTNNHVISGANKVSIQIAGASETVEGQLVGADENTDLAVIKITSKDDLTVAKLGDSNSLQVGERAIAIGNPLGMEFFGTTTQGIISAVNRSVKVSENLTMNYIQTDAAINSGNSGGALVNAYGEVIGVNSAKISDSSVEGMGFAIPISEAKVVVEDLVKYGYVKGRPVIGITTVDVTASIAKRYGWPEGVWVNSVVSGSGAEEAGLKRGDIITSANGKDITSVNELNEIKNKMKPGDKLKLKVYRENSNTIDITVTLSEDTPTQSK